jgi:hypothetical protein
MRKNLFVIFKKQKYQHGQNAAENFVNRKKHVYIYVHAHMYLCVYVYIHTYQHGQEAAHNCTAKGQFSQSQLANMRLGSRFIQ